MTSPFEKPPNLNDRQRFAIHFFDERGHSVMTQLWLHSENRRLEVENARLRELLAKLTRERIERAKGDQGLA